MDRLKTAELQIKELRRLLVEAAIYIISGHYSQNLGQSKCHMGECGVDLVVGMVL